MLKKLIDRLTRGDRAEAIEVFDDDAMLDLLQDDDLAGLLDELAGLGDVAVPAAARERSWALVRQEVRARAGRGAFAAGRTSRVAYWRYALGSAAVVVAAVVGIVTFNGHEAPEVVSNSTSTNATSAPTSTAPSTSSTEPVRPTSTSGSPSTTGGSTPGTGASTTDTAPSSGTTGVSELKPPPATVTTAPTTPTTAPERSTTTNEPVMTQERREQSAIAVATVLGQEIAEANPSGASQVLKSSAAPGLTMMVKSMVAPTDPRIASVSVGSPVTRVLLAFTDRVPDGQGGTTHVERRFALDVQILGGDAYITGIFQAAE